MSAANNKQNGLRAALLSALILGTTPILGKLAYAGGMNPYSLTAFRTLIAAGAMWLFYLGIKSNRKFIFIYPAGLLISFFAGALNGLSSLLYYNGLTHIDAGVGQMLYSLYPLFVVIFCRLDGQRVSGWTLIRLIIALIAVALLVLPGKGQIDFVGVGLMLGAGMMYAWHLAVSQRVLYEMPPQTVTLYVLTSMTIVVWIAFLIHGPSAVPDTGIAPMMILAAVTVLSRLSMFLGVKHLGSVQTALLGVTEILVAVMLAIGVLNEQLILRQWIGAAFLICSLILIIFEPGWGRPLPEERKQPAVIVDEAVMPSDP
ncbi:MAG TPA: DMT family transporter [Anaerolineae bacterium]|nr:DMT family transporter [Anaerolineae bacterium]